METDPDENLEQGVFPGCTLEYFSEHQIIIELILNIENIFDDDIQYESSLQKFQFIMDQYREQAHLLDSHLDEILDEIIVRVRNINAPMSLKHKLFKYLYMIINVRGYKVIVKKLPHEVSIL
ncbi:tubulin-specific chaperone D-like [Diaphorina citri]|uniref:Tubulin-specific chaperone D-like n=1 Tax=Diaphorina citri TaxID=121845 RepID=A0A3Q0IUV8_DIACI|nr:tubulin-specific chaperone D-like [Diaphorina citri]XP_026680061.1 tubulin-specific chaperone D-like [Diaphorina citri]